MTSETRDRVIRVGAVDNHPVVLKGIGAALAETAPDCELVAVADSARALVESTPELDVVLLDLGMEREGTVADDIATLTEHGAVVLIFTSEERPVPVRQAIEAGAMGLILKIDPIEAIADTIRSALAGELVCSGAMAHALLTDPVLTSRLSGRQVEILQGISEGLPYRAVARRMHIAESTVREHLNRAVSSYRTRGIDPGNTHGLVKIARQEGHLED